MKQKNCNTFKTTKCDHIYIYSMYFILNKLVLICLSFLLLFLFPILTLKMSALQAIFKYMCNCTYLTVISFKDFILILLFLQLKLKSGIPELTLYIQDQRSKGDLGNRKVHTEMLKMWQLSWLTTPIF